MRTVESSKRVKMQHILAVIGGAAVYLPQH